MLSTPVRILPRHHLSAIEIGLLEEQLYSHNRLATGQADGQNLAFEAWDNHTLKLGSIAGYSWAGVAEIKQLVVDKGHRGQGLGSSLLTSFITEAMVRGCQSVWVLSYSFQAPSFYEKHGFESVAELTDWPPGHAHIVLRRRIGRAG